MSDPTNYWPTEPDEHGRTPRPEERRVDRAMAVDSVDDALSRNPDQNAADQELRAAQAGEEDIPEEVRRLREDPSER